MSAHRTVYFASTILTGFACLALGGCSVSVQAGSEGPRAPSHEHREKKDKSSTKDKTSTKDKKKSSTEKKKETSDKKDETPETPKKTETKETPVKPGLSRVVVPIDTSLKELKAKLEQELPTKEVQKDWKRVGKKNSKREVDIRYEVWRNPIELSVREHTLRVVVPVEYASDFRGKVDKPIGKGKIWVTHGETWGTKDHKQTMKVTFDFNLDVSDDYKLESNSKLVSIEHGAPPSGNACTNTTVNICVPKKDLASYVEDELNDKVGKKIEKALKKGDKKIEGSLDLKKHIEALWSAMATPIELQKANQNDCPTETGKACSKSAWFAFTPNSLSLSPVELNGDALGVRVALDGKLNLTENAPTEKAPELPKLQRISGGTTFELNTAFDIPIERLAEKLSKALEDTPLHVGRTALKVKSASIRVTDDAKKALILELVTEKGEKLGFNTSLEFDAKKKLFGLTKLVPDATTKMLLEKELKELDVAALEKTINEHVTVALDTASEALRDALSKSLSKSLPGKFRLKGSLSEAALEDFSLTNKGISTKVKLTGPLSVEIVP